MTVLVELDIVLSKINDGSYSVELRSALPGSDADVRVFSETTFDFEKLQSCCLDNAIYGRLLAESLFKNAEIQDALGNARFAAQIKEVPLQIRLFIDRNAAELQLLRWETLLDPRSDSHLFTGERVWFSRYLGSSDYQPVRPRQKGLLASLVAVPNPSNLAEFRLAPVDVMNESARARDSLQGTAIQEVAASGPATLPNIVDRLRTTPTDIFYLVCHGSVVDGESWLWMEDPAGKVAHVRGADFVERVKELERRPLLIVLASCQSGIAATNGKGLTALGPGLIDAGVPAVIAMQGSVTMKTVAQFMPAFFKELLRTGQIDRAMAVARGMVRDRSDFWMPVLFMRLRSGRVWQETGENQTEKKKPGRYVLAAAVTLICAVFLFALLPSKRIGPTNAATQIAPGTQEQTPTDMLRIAGETFMMGRNGFFDDASSPAHEVTVHAFDIDRLPVTKGRYWQFVRKLKGDTDPVDTQAIDGSDDQPATEVTWDEAAAFCLAEGKRLPSEAEWELAARGNDGRLYPWGEEFKPMAVNSREAGVGHAEAVAARPENKSPFGVLDMTGNVWEWCDNDYYPYAGSLARFAIPSAAKVIRGGSFQSDRLHVTALTRNLELPSRRSRTIGFRCAK